MPLINPVDSTSSLDQERQTLNQVITALNNVTTGKNVFTLQEPVGNEDLLVYDSATGTFTNIAAAVLISTLLQSQITLSQSQLKPYYWATMKDIR